VGTPAGAGAPRAAPACALGVASACPPPVTQREALHKELPQCLLQVLSHAWLRPLLPWRSCLYQGLLLGPPPSHSVLLLVPLLVVLLLLLLVVLLLLLLLLLVLLCCCCCSSCCCCCCSCCC